LNDDLQFVSIQLVHPSDWTSTLKTFDASEINISNVRLQITSKKTNSEVLVVKSRTKQGYRRLVKTIEKHPEVLSISFAYPVSRYPPYCYIVSTVEKNNSSVCLILDENEAVPLSLSYFEGLEHWKFVCKSAFIDKILTSMEDICEIGRLRIKDLSFDDINGGMTHPNNLSRMESASLSAAKKMGYFAWPHQVSLNDIASTLFISKSALNEYLRKGIRKLVDRELGSP